ncbi:hypothetical protein [Sinorhizobium meliloti]|uniref:hypothetical protein n=1 Tax=Rhizobium meliloti TaxID=382 RepID=UPI000FD6E4DB|nr:hypothetical protein [Sinorhizobium meliloti]MDX0276744.1 hypothetical protein [Sinorhizobium meliloti]RVG30750.1 hypothetical protein CN229_11940 [Sinorhizobium meliloti]
MSKHTPGPWTVEPPSDQTPHIWITAPTSSGVAKIETCNYDDGQGERLTDEDFANALVIAAAPDLLAALKSAAAAIGDWSRPTGANGMVPASLGHPLMVAQNQMYDAIAKAEGRS